MKKAILILSLVCFIIHMNAQDTKKYGPETGNYCVGISANPALEFIGNFFGKVDNNQAPTADLAGGYNLLGKYFIENNKAIRSGISFASSSNTNYWGTDDENKNKTSGIGFAFALGLEKRIGSNRIQAFYGPSIGVGILNNSSSNIYKDTPATGTLLKESTGTTVSFALGGFTGVEFFLTSNIAVGTELGLCLKIESKGKGKKEFEGLPSVETGSKSTSTSFGFSDSPAQLAPKGKIYVSFYF